MKEYFLVEALLKHVHIFSTLDSSRLIQKFSDRSFIGRRCCCGADAVRWQVTGDDAAHF